MERKFTLEDFNKYREMLLQGTDGEQRETIANIRQASSIENDPPLGLIISAGLVPVLMRLHREKKDLPNTAKHDILWAITNVASGNSQDTMHVISNNGVQYFLEFCNDPDEEVFAQALWGLANMAGESAVIRDHLLELGGMETCLKIYNTHKDTLKIDTKRTISWTVNNLCRSKPSVKFEKIKGCLTYLRESLSNETDQDILTENLWACSYISDIGEEAVKQMIEHELIKKVTDHFFKANQQIVILTPSFRTLSNVVSGSDVNTDYVLSLNILPSVVELLKHQKSAIRKEACFFLSNVAAGEPSQIQQMYENPDLLPGLHQIIFNDENNVKIEALWVVSNSMMGGSSIHKMALLKSELPIKILESIRNFSNKAIKVFLDGLGQLVLTLVEFPNWPDEGEQLFALLRDRNSSAMQYLSELAKTDADIKTILEDIRECVEEPLQVRIERNDGERPLMRED